jgi:hypothetical protein
VDRAHARPVRASDGTPLSASRGSTSPSQPAAASPALASSPTPALAGIFMAPRISEVDVSMPPDSRGWKRDALARTPVTLRPRPRRSARPPRSHGRRSRGTGALQAALAAAAPPAAAPPAAAPPAAAPQPLTASSALWFDSPSMAQCACLMPGCPAHATLVPPLAGAHFGVPPSARPG